MENTEKMENIQQKKFKQVNYLKIVFIWQWNGKETNDIKDEGKKS